MRKPHDAGSPSGSFHRYDCQEHPTAGRLPHRQDPRSEMRHTAMRAASATLLLYTALFTHAHAQTSIGTIQLDASAWLVLGPSVGNDRGLLQPRVALSGFFDTASIRGGVPPAGLTVYNTATNGGTTPMAPGLYTWNGTQWISNSAGTYFHSNSSIAANATLATSGATGSNALAAGAGAAASRQNATALGNGATASHADSIALGAGSTTRAAVGTASAVIGSATYGGFAGSAPVAVASVGSDGSTRQLVNVAAGQITAISTDAVNGSQLYSVASGLDARIAATQAGAVRYDALADGSPDYDNVTLQGQATQVHNLAPGTAPRDAVNLGQLHGAVNALGARIDTMARNAYGGIASAMAIQMPASFVPGKTVMRLGTAVYKGVAALGAGFRRTSANNAWSLTGGIGVSRAGKAVSMGVEWTLD